MLTRRRLELMAVTIAARALLEFGKELISSVDVALYEIMVMPR
jgi:hypothetical protein